MDTVNIVLSMILCALLGFAIGKAYGMESAKRTFVEFIRKLTESIKATAEVTKEKEPDISNGHDWINKNG